MILFIFFTWITIPLLFVDYTSESMAVGSYRTHFENSRYKRNTLEKLSCGTEIHQQGIKLINFGINAIYEDVASKTIDIRDNFYDTLSNLYTLSGTQKRVREFVTIELYKFKNRTKDKEFKDIPSFNEAVIHFYTTYYAYKEINACLRQHECNKKTLTIEEQYLAPYSAVLMSVLLYWPELIKENGTTYRGVNLEQRQIDEFTEGLKFTWPSFISSSGIESGASKKNFTCQFVFDNSESTRWSPKQIWNYAYDRNQNEALYPPGVQFQVTKKQINDDGQAKIYLKLLGKDESEKTDAGKDESEKTDAGKNESKKTEEGNKLFAIMLVCPVNISVAIGIVLWMKATRRRNILQRSDWICVSWCIQICIGFVTLIGAMVILVQEGDFMSYALCVIIVSVTISFLITSVGIQYYTRPIQPGDLHEQLHSTSQHNSNSQGGGELVNIWIM